MSRNRFFENLLSDSALSCTVLCSIICIGWFQKIINIYAVNYAVCEVSFESWMVLQFSAIITSNIMSHTAQAKHYSEFELTIDTPYLALTGKLWGAYREDLGENWPTYKGNVLYCANSGTVFVAVWLRSCWRYHNNHPRMLLPCDWFLVVGVTMFPRTWQQQLVWPSSNSQMRMDVPWTT